MSRRRVTSPQRHLIPALGRAGPPPPGITWNQPRDTWTKSTTDDLTAFLNQLTRVNMAPNGAVTAVYGDPSYAEDGTNGRVMVRIPRFWVKTTVSRPNVYNWQIAPTATEGFILHPAFYQRNHVGNPVDYIYVSAYEADLIPAASGVHQLHSRAGFQPMNGYSSTGPNIGGGVWVLDFDAGQDPPAIDDVVQADVGGDGESDQWIVLGCELTAGAWDGSGVGKLWIRQINNAAPTDWDDNDTITNITQSNVLGDIDGAVAPVHITAQDAEDWANRVGLGWGTTNIWTWSAVKLLMLMDWGDFHGQTRLARGAVDMTSPHGFNGVLTGSHNINANLDATLTGAGDDGLAGEAEDGKRPVTWRGLENPWGNLFHYLIGYNSTDAEYRIVKKEGLADTKIPAALPAGSYDASEGPPLGHDSAVEGFISDFEFEPLLDLLFIPSAVAGDGVTHIPDKFWSHSPASICLPHAGSCW